MIPTPTQQESDYLLTAVDIEGWEGEGEERPRATTNPPDQKKQKTKNKKKGKRKKERKVGAWAEKVPQIRIRIQVTSLWAFLGTPALRTLSHGRSLPPAAAQDTPLFDYFVLARLFRRHVFVSV
jgi:hypothetical protein